MRRISQLSIALPVLAGVTVFAQTADKTQHFVYNAYWSASDGFQSKAELHNNSTIRVLSVIPFAYDANGRSVQLDSITLPPLGNATIDVNAQLAGKNWGNQHAAGTIVFQYNATHAGVL
ncbi:MAG TPA: hypothetical protein VFA65_07455 [Bryobacteraceae bacterium]|nr:hypothetical protein [Bryobacteraceae bacterium]